MQPRPAPEPFLPLAGVRVADFSRLLPGPYCAWVLKRLGASVVKVEDAAAGDYTRMVPPAVGNHGGMFHVLQRGSRSLAVDLRHPEGRGVAERLCAASDVVLEGFRPGVLGAMGLGPEELLERHPRLVVCSISGFGQQGAFRSRAGHDLNYLALAGVLALAGPWGMPAPPPPLPLADLAGGALPAVIGILGALLERGGTRGPRPLTPPSWSIERIAIRSQARK